MSSSPGIPLAFRDVNFSVDESTGFRVCGDYVSTRKDILTDANGIVQPGQCCAILGSSGSGKTSLLDIIARNNTSKNVTGKIMIGGYQLSPTMMREHCGYVMQDDSHLVQLTVRETLTYSALLRLPAKMSRGEKLQRVEEVLSDLGLRNVANTRVGGGYVRGVSGGERRRVSIGVQLLKDPPILLLDEPTTGLDAFTANNIVSTLSGLAKRNKTIIFTIHQPRSDIFPLLDVVMLLSQGKTVYFGPREQIIDYFSSVGFPCDIYSNPLDYYIDVVSIDKRSELRQANTTELLERLHQAYNSSEIGKNVLKVIAGSEQSPVDSEMIYQTREKPGFFAMLKILVSRNSTHLFRSFSEVWDRVTQPVLFFFLIWLFLFRLGHDQSSVQNRSGLMYEMVSGPIFISMIHAIAGFPAIRNLYYRECIDSLYSSPVFVMAYLIHLIPTMIFGNVLASGFGYWAIGLYPEFYRFVIFMCLAGLLVLLGEAIGMFVLGIFFDPNIGNSVAALILSISALVGTGFLRSAQSIPKIFQKLSYLSAFRYGSEIAYVNEFRDLELTCPPYLPCDYPSGNDYLDEMYPGAVDRMGKNFVALVLMAGVYVGATMILFQFHKKSLR